MMSNLDVDIIAQNELNIPEAREVGLTFVENAIIKARHACKYTNLPAIADDSGLEVDALNGAPGIYSARYAGAKAVPAENIAKLLYELRDVPKNQLTARFRCCIVYLEHEKHPMPMICSGTWEGSIVFEQKGKNGFGYDPIFFVPEYNCTAAELSSEIKNKISHRAQAMLKLKCRLKMRT